MTDHEDLKFYIDDRIREGLESIYEKIQDDLFEIVKQHMQEFTGDILTGEQAAQMLGVSYKTLLNKVKEYSLEPTKEHPEEAKASL